MSPKIPEKTPANNAKMSVQNSVNKDETCFREFNSKAYGNSVNLSENQELVGSKKSQLGVMSVQPKFVIAPIKLDERAMLPVSVGDLQVRALVDTGATWSVMPKMLLDHLLKQKNVVKGFQNLENVSTITASCDQIPLVSKADIHFKIDYLAWDFPFHIAEKLPIDIILGRDFLRHSLAVINVAKQEIEFPYHQTVTMSLPEAEQTEETQLTPKYGENLSESQLEQVKKLISQFPDTVTKTLGKTNILTYHINIKNDHKVRCRPYQLAPPKSKILQEQIDQLLSKGVIRESTSQFASPAFLVPKKDGSHRLVINYKALNKGITLEATPTPNVETAFSHLGQAKFFTLIDLNSAYHQIPLDEESKKFTAFCTEKQLYEWNYMPFGLSSGSMSLVELLTRIFGDITHKFLYAFFDDIVIYSNTFEEHLVHVEEVFKRLRKAGLTANPSKMTVASNRIEFLGHVIHDGRLTLDPERCKPIAEFPKPKNVKQLARFIGMTAFYARFIPNYAQVTAPLNLLKRKDQPFIWSQDQETAFNTLREALSSPPILRMPDFSKEFTVHTDASRHSVAAVLSQTFEGNLHPVAYASRATNDHEKNYAAFELEALGVVFALNKFRTYLEHRKFSLHTDNNALTWLLGHPKQIGKIARWLTLINAFQFDVHHIKGRLNTVADTLSRMYETVPENSPQTALKLPPQARQDIQPETLQVTGQCNSLFKIPEAFQDIEQHQKNDPDIQDILSKIRKGTEVPNYAIVNNILTHKFPTQTKPRVFVPKSLIPVLFKYYHQSPTTAHLGIQKTWQRIEPHFWRETIKKDISDMVRACNECQRSKQAPNTKVGLLSSEVSPHSFYKIHIDFVGPLPRSKQGNTYLLTVIDSFSKYTIFLPARNTNSKTVVNLLEKGVFAYFAFPKFMVTDNVKYFTSREVADMCLKHGIRHVTTSPYYPNPSHAERANKNIKTAIRIFHSSDHTDWDKNIHFFQIAFNSAQHRSTGLSPAQLFLGREIHQPLELNWNLDQLISPDIPPKTHQENWATAIQNLRAAHQQRADQYNKGRKETNFEVGDWVMYREHHQSKAVDKINFKLLPLWSKPCVIQGFISPVTVSLADGKTGRFIRRAHVSQLKRYFKPNL